jgi:hypothetical protein
LGGIDGGHGHRVWAETIQVDQESGLEDKACLKVEESPQDWGDSCFFVSMQGAITKLELRASLMKETSTNSYDDTRKSLAQLLTPEHQAHATLATLVSFLGCIRYSVVYYTVTKVGALGH